MSFPMSPRDAPLAQLAQPGGRKSGVSSIHGYAGNDMPANKANYSTSPRGFTFKAVAARPPPVAPLSTTPLLGPDYDASRSLKKHVPGVSMRGRGAAVTINPASLTRDKNLGTSCLTPREKLSPRSTVHAYDGEHNGVHGKAARDMGGRIRNRAATFGRTKTDRFDRSLAGRTGHGSLPVGCETGPGFGVASLNI